MGHDAVVSTPEADRHLLYTGLVELLGEHRAGTLMTYLPSYDPAAVATRADLADLITRFEARFDQIDARFDHVDARFDHIDARFERFEARFDRLDSRVDRVFLTLAAGLLAIVATLAIALVSGLT